MRNPILNFKIKIKMKMFIVALVLSTAAVSVQAQEYKVAKSTGRLEIHAGRVTVEGYNGNEIIFTARDGKDNDDDRAKGLQAINAAGLTDTGGLGVNVSVNGDVISVNQLRKTSSPDIHIRVPKAIIVSFDHASQYGGDATFRNMENEIEIAAQYNSINLENVTGPMTVKTIYGHVEATFGETVRGPISIVSVYGYVDVTLPGATKANLRLDTSYGEILVSPDFKIEMTGGRDEDVQGKINGGGMNIDLSCNYGKVYLRKK
jgi:hypothetical protein